MDNPGKKASSGIGGREIGQVLPFVFCLFKGFRGVARWGFGSRGKAFGVVNALRFQVRRSGLGFESGVLSGLIVDFGLWGERGPGLSSASLLPVRRSGFPAVFAVGSA